MNRCSRCVMPDTRPDVPFIDGVCAACLSYERRSQIDWKRRSTELIELLAKHDGRCIVPSSGGKDSTYQVLRLKQLGAKPVVVTATTCHLTDIGRKNIDNLAHYCETVEVTPNMTQRAKLNRLGLEMVGDISWPEHVGIFTIPFRIACHMNIPLIFYGENPQDQYGGPNGSEQARTMTRRWVSEFGGFLGLRPTDVESMAGDMSLYMPPPQADIERVGVEAHFLGQYLPWDSHQNAAKAIAAGFAFRRPCSANWWPWENQDNAQTGLHDYMMWRKYGYTRGCAQISVDIRAGRVKRDTAMAWLKAYPGEFPKTYMGVDNKDIIERIGVTKDKLRQIMDYFTDWTIMRRVVDDADVDPILIDG